MEAKLTHESRSSFTLRSKSISFRIPSVVSHSWLLGSASVNFKLPSPYSSPNIVDTVIGRYHERFHENDWPINQ
jgi:hypothetical protein